MLVLLLLPTILFSAVVALQFNFDIRNFNFKNIPNSEVGDFTTIDNQPNVCNAVCVCMMGTWSAVVYLWAFFTMNGAQQ